jgi:hypothetical protein
MLRTRFFVWCKIPSLIYNFLAHYKAVILKNLTYAKYAAVSGETVIVVLASLFALLRFAVSGGVEAFAGTSHDF